MKIKVFKNLGRHKQIRPATYVAACAMLIATVPAYAAVVQRGSTGTTTTARPSVTRANVAAHAPAVAAATTTPVTADVTAVTTTETTEPEIVIENKASQFDQFMTSVGVDNTTTTDNRMAELIQAQRAALDSQDAINTAATAVASGRNTCDLELRACMQDACGTDFLECRGDSDSIWGMKMDSCRNSIDTKCTGEEYRLFSAEIKADRDTNAQLSMYNSIITCGSQYNSCIETECGTNFTKCLGKSAGDAAIEKCKSIADKCVEQDSGLASRAMTAFSNLRINAENQVYIDEERLADLMDQMRTQCEAMGALFDERSLDCVFTVEFYAGDDSTLYASKKAYAGSTFSCTPDWFGIDITTFMENAYRTTRAQSSATSALMGSGLGIAAGAITSGAIDRAVDRQRAESALKDAKKEYEQNYGNNATDTDDKDAAKNETGDNATTTAGTSAPTSFAIGSDTSDNNSQTDSDNKTNDTANSNNTGQTTTRTVATRASR